MKLKTQLILTVSAMMTVVIVSVSVVLLTQARSMQTQAVYENMENLTGYYSMRIQNQFENYLNVTKSIADVVNSYSSFDVEERRPSFDAILQGIMESNQDFIGMFYLLKPDTIDNDADYAGTALTDESGRYMTYITRTRGFIEKHPLTVYKLYDDVYNSIDLNSPSLSNPYHIDLSGESVFVAQFCYPIIDVTTEMIIGQVGIIFNFGRTTGIVEEIRPYGVGHALLSSNDGQIVTYYNESLVGQFIKETSLNDLIGEKLMSEIDDGLRLGESALGYNNNIFFCSYPFYIGDITTPWYLITSAPEDEVIRSVNTLTQLTIIIIIATVLISAVIIFFVSDHIAKPLVRIALTLKDISEGERDLTKTVNVKDKNEIGDLARYFNATIEKIKDLVITIKNQSIQLFGIGNDLASNMSETAAAINQITINIQNIKSRIINQSASVTETNATMEQITANINKLNDHIENQTSSVAQSSSAIEQMLMNIKSVTDTLIKNAGNVKELAEASEVGRSGLQEVASDIQEIARESEGLLEINAVMENIASQTNLLSMNAAIEAAHAGDAGKGFAVVADEIRKLAENSAEQSQTIATVLKKIKESIDKISKSTDTVINKFAAIDEGVKLVAGQEENIRDAMEEQNHGSKQVLEAVSRMKEITDQVKNGSLEMLQGSKSIIHEESNLSMITEEITGGMDEIARGTEQINISVNQVNQISGTNKDNINILVQEVSKFKVE